MWSRMYRDHILMAFPTYDTAAKAWVPQADITWFAGPSRKSTFVRFSDRCARERDAVTCALSKAQGWIDLHLHDPSDKAVGPNERGTDRLTISKNEPARV
jgi:hypothetical protein